MGNEQNLSLISQLNSQNPSPSISSQLNNYPGDPDTQQTNIEQFFNHHPNLSNLSLLTYPPSAQSLLSISLPNKEVSIPSKYELESLPFNDKVNRFRTYLNSIKIDWRKGSDNIQINRDKIISMSIEQFKNINIYKELKINFIGEINEDAGGLIREWLTCIFQEFEKEELGIFEKADTQDFSLKMKSSGINLKDKEKIEIYRFIGIVIAKALMENLTINTCFNKYIYKIIFEEKVNLQDMLFIDQKIYHSLSKLKELKKEEIDALEMTFSIDTKNDDNKLIHENLIINGSNVKVTKDNLDFYIECYIRNLINKDRIPIQIIKSGLVSIIPEKLIKIFTVDEFELLLNGTPFIDVFDWEQNANYVGYFTTDNIIRNFWDIMGELNQEELSIFLQFCTGSKRVPIGGFKSLESNRGNKSPFCITMVVYDTKGNNFIRAHTCFNRIDLPNYPNKEELKSAIRFIIDNQIIGFGIE